MVVTGRRSLDYNRSDLPRSRLHAFLVGSVARMTTPIVIGIIVLLLLIAAAFSAVIKARRLAMQDAGLSDDELTEFQRMREEGAISEEEFRRLKKIVSEQTVEKVKRGQ